MLQTFLKKAEIFFSKYYILIFISLFSLFSIILPFILSNNLEGFDTAGQYANAFYIKNFFWPFPGGWNSMFLSGFPQGIFYPPFFSWLVSLFGFILPLDISYKLILSSAIFLFPIIIFIFALKLFNKDFFKASIVLTLVSIFYYLDMGLNDNLFSDIYFGMSPHLFSLTLFILYLLFLFKLIKNNNKWYIASILLAVLVITHVITAAAAVLFSFTLLILGWKDKILRIKLLKHYLFAFLLSSWWTIPFLLNIQYVSGGDMTSKEVSIITLSIPVIALLSLAVYKIKSENNLIFKTISVFSLFIFASYLSSRFFSISNFPIHFGRLLIYPFLIFPFTLVYYLNSKNINWKKISLALFFCFCFYLFYFKIIPVGPFDVQILNGVDSYRDNSRTIVTGDSTKLDDRFHATRTKLATEHNFLISGGLFTESSSNGWFTMSLLKSWDAGLNENFLWGYNDLVDVADLAWGSSIFGINYEYRIQDTNPNQEERDLILSRSEDQSLKSNPNLDFKINRKRLLDDEKSISMLAGKDSPFYYQTLYKINNTGIAEVLNIKPVNITEKWKDNTVKWWTTDWLKIEKSDTYKKPILVYNTPTADWVVPEEGLVLPFSEDKKMNIFTVDASDLKENAPIYIKVEYFPFWKAYDESGKKLEVYKASPNFMMVYSKGKITFKYEEDKYYYWGFIVSGSSLLFLIFNFIFNKIKKVKENSIDTAL